MSYAGELQTFSSLSADGVRGRIYGAGAGLYPDALAAVREVGPAEVRTATSFVRPGGYRPDFHAMETDALIVFPWDRQVIEDQRLVTPAIYA